MMFMEQGPSLIEAGPWIARFRNKVVVVKLGGELLEQRSTVARLVTQVLVLWQCGLRPILVHGGGVQVDEGCRARGIEIRKVNGRRITSYEVMQVLLDVIGRLNQDLVEQLQQVGVPAVGKGHAVRCTRRPLFRQADGTAIDWGFVGDVIGFDESLIPPSPGWSVPVLPSLGIDAEETLLNVNADTVASRVAVGAQAEKLIFLTSVPGVMRDPNDPGPISQLTLSSAQELLSGPAVKGGMRAKMEESLKAVQGGVPKVHILAGKEPHTLLREIFTHEGCGTEITLE